MSLNRLPNAFHFETVMKTLERVGATNVPQQNAAFRPLYEDLMTKFQREDTAYKQSQKNFKSDQIKKLDDDRDKYADCIRRVAEEWAKTNNIPVTVFPAQWDKYGRSAGMIRNKLIISASDHCIAFWDGVSRGTKNDIELCQRLNVPCTIIRF